MTLRRFSSFSVACMITFVAAAGTAAGQEEVDVLGLAQASAGPSDGQPHFSPPPWEPRGVEGNVTSAPATTALEYNVYCQQDFEGPEADGAYPWDGAACWTFVNGAVLGVPLDAMFVCAATLREPNAPAYDWIPCVAVVQAGGTAFVAVAYCYGASPGGTFADSPACLAGAGTGTANHETGQYPPLQTVAAAGFGASGGSVCVQMYNATSQAQVACANGSFCPTYNPQALTNACFGPSSMNVTRPDAHPTIVPGPGICLIGDICAPIGVANPPVDPGLGTAEEDVPILSGFFEATAACAISPASCRIDVPPA